VVDDFGDLDAFGPGDGSGEAVGYAGTGEGTYDSASDSYTMPSVSNISNSDSYDPTFAAEAKLSRGLDPRGLQGFNTTAFNNPEFLSQYGSTSNPLEQLNESQQANVLNAMTSARNYTPEAGLRSSFIENYRNNPMGLINDIKTGKIDAETGGQVFGSLGLNIDRPYGDSTFSLFGKEANYPMSPKDKAELGVTALNYNLSGKDPTRFSENPYTTVKRGIQDAGIAALKEASDFIVNSSAGKSVTEYLQSLNIMEDNAKNAVVQDSINNNPTFDGSTGLPVGQKSFFDQLKESGQVENAGFNLGDVNQQLKNQTGTGIESLFKGFEKPVINTDILPSRFKDSSGNLEVDLYGKNVLSARNDGTLTNKTRFGDGNRLNTSINNLVGSDKGLSFNLSDQAGTTLNTGNVLDENGFPINLSGRSGPIDFNSSGYLDRNNGFNLNNTNVGYQGENFRGNMNISGNNQPYFSTSGDIPFNDNSNINLSSRGNFNGLDSLGAKYTTPGPFGLGTFSAGAQQNFDGLNPLGRTDLNINYGINSKF